MNKKQTLTCAFIALAWSFAPALADTVEANARTAVAANPSAANAAVLYWNAFGAMPELTTAEKELLTQKSDQPLDEAAATKLVTKFKASIKILQQATQRPMCNWELNLEEGLELKMPHIGKGMELSKAVRLSALLHLRQGRPAEVVNDLLAMLRLSRALGEPGFLLNNLVQISVESWALDCAAAQFNQFDADSLAKLAAGLRTLPPGHSMKEAMQFERDFGPTSWVRKEVAQCIARHEAFTATWLANIFTPVNCVSELPTEPGKLDIAAFGGDWEGFNRLLDATNRDYDEYIKLMDLPYPRFESEAAAFLQRLQAANPISIQFFPAINRCRGKEVKAQVRREMFLAAAGAQQAGDLRGGLANSRDPFGVGAFGVREVKDGLELQSKLTVDKEPVTLTLRLPGK